MATDVFRFMAIRPPQVPRRRGTDTRFVRLKTAGEAESPFHAQLKRLREQPDARSLMRRAAADFVQNNGFLEDSEALPFDLVGLESWLQAQKHPWSADAVIAEVTRRFGVAPTAFIQQAAFKEARQRLADSFIALSITASRSQGPATSGLAQALRLMGLIERLATDSPSLYWNGAVERALKAIVLLPSDIFPLPAALDTARRDRRTAAHAEHERVRAERLASLRGKFDRLRQLRAAGGELKAALESDLVERRKNRPSGSSGEIAVPEVMRLDDANIVLRRAARAEAERVPEGAAPAPRAMPLTARWNLSNEAVARLTQPTRTVLTGFNLPMDFVDVPSTVALVDSTLVDTGAELYEELWTHNYADIGATAVMNDLFGPASPMECPVPGVPGVADTPASERPGPSELRLLSQPLGVGDLMVVRQELVKYELGEVAHIANVMPGETNRREHRRKRTTEETLFEETETTEEEERELESTERFELQRESQQTISQETSTEAGIVVNASYGMSVDVEATAGFASSTAKESSDRTASSLSRDITNRAVSRVQERVLRRRMRRTLEEFEELNFHQIDNSNGERVAGIYRWVNKLYRAQVVNYGRRLMFDFTLPEPAAFYRFARSSMPAAKVGVEKPVPPQHFEWDSNGQSGRCLPLSPHHITEDNYLSLVARYEVEGTTPPPPAFTTIATTVQEPLKEEGTPLYTQTNEKLEVTEGYEAIAAWAKQESSVYEGIQPDSPAAFALAIGRRRLDFSKGEEYTELDRENNLVPVAVLAWKIAAWAMAIEVLCERTIQKFQEWQIKTYNSIMTAYRDKLARYEEAVAAANIQAGVTITGRNPLLNREVERTELKKLAISMLSDQYFDDFDAMRKNVAPVGYPEIDRGEALGEGLFIQFFEQAFEWSHMTYLFYPYFWGRKQDWPIVSQLDDTDPIFAKFLQAGAARVRVPVRPAFETAVLALVTAGAETPPGGDPPLVDNDISLAFIEELREQLDNDFIAGDGTLSVVQGSVSVTGASTDFSGDDVRREIRIASEVYHIASVPSPTEVALTRPYEGPTAQDLAYSMGARLVGDPWEVAVPTSLVVLQAGDELP